VAVNSDKLFHTHTNTISISHKTFSFPRSISLHPSLERAGYFWLMIAASVTVHSFQTAINIVRTQGVVKQRLTLLEVFSIRKDKELLRLTFGTQPTTVATRLVGRDHKLKTICITECPQNAHNVVQVQTMNINTKTMQESEINN
jgi:hypothetical protein